MTALVVVALDVSLHACMHFKGGGSQKTGCTMGREGTAQNMISSLFRMKYNSVTVHIDEILNELSSDINLMGFT